MDSNCGIEGLPNEILLEIISYGCNSQATYLSHLLINKRFYALVKYDRLPCIPIRINSRSLRPFFEFVTTLGMAEYVQYLWINGTSLLCSEIVRACRNLISLACSKKDLYSLCTPLPSDINFRHTQLKELTIFDNWDCWYALQEPPHYYASELFCQITHLRLHDPLSISFTADLLPSLTHFSCSCRPRQPPELQLTCVSSLPKLENISITTYFWRNEPVDDRTLDLLAKDKRIRFLFFGPNEPGEFELWCGRARKTTCLWTAQASLRRIL
jgi:hypothetical protein